MAALTQHLPTTDRSTSITAGGTAQDVYTANQQPKAGWEFVNNSDTVMYLDFDKDATTSKGIPVQAGQSYYMPGPAGVIPSGRLSVLCATTGKTFVFKSW
jgi:hypothetical protein